MCNHKMKIYSLEDLFYASALLNLAYKPVVNKNYVIINCHRCIHCLNKSNNTIAKRKLKCLKKTLLFV